MYPMHVHRFKQLMGLLSIWYPFAHTGTHTNVNLELSPVRTPYEFQKTLYTVFVYPFRYILRICLPTKLTSSEAGFQLSEVKSPNWSEPATVQLFQHSGKTFWTQKSLSIP